MKEGSKHLGFKRLVRCLGFVNNTMTAAVSIAGTLQVLVAWMRMGVCQGQLCMAPLTWGAPQRWLMGVARIPLGF